MQSNSIYDKIYCAIFVLIGTLVVVSPITAHFGYSNYDRVIDTLMILTLIIRLTEISQTRFSFLASDAWFLGPFLFYFILASASEYYYGNFHLPLFVLEAKILVFLFLTRLFYQRPLISRVRRKKLSLFMFSCFLIGATIYLVAPSGARLHLLNESNYTILSLLFVALCVVHNFKLDSTQTKWWLLTLVLVGLTVVSRSRTGFAMLILYFIFNFASTRTLPLAIPVSLVAALAYITFGDYLIDTITRGAFNSGADHIDRFVFLKEYVFSLQDKPWYTFLISWNIADYYNEQVYYMSWWVAKQSAQHDIPFGLAPYNFHSAYLRLLSAYGVFITIALLGYVYQILRTTNMFVVALIFLAAVSMSVFYLSSVNPFVLLTLLTISNEARIRHKQKFTNPEVATLAQEQHAPPKAHR